MTPFFEAAYSCKMCAKESLSVTVVGLKIRIFTYLLACVNYRFLHRV